jgi:hypothetical protein
VVGDRTRDNSLRKRNVDGFDNNDQGQGDRVTTPLVFVNSYPYQLSSPEVKVSFKLRRNVDWITGYQYIDYKERFANNQFYQAHLPYTSLRLYFGRAE